MSQNRDRERFVFSVPRDNRRHSALLVDVVLCCFDVIGKLTGGAGRVKHCMSQHRRRDIADALNGVSPTAVFVLMLGQPVQAASNQSVKVGFQ